MENVKVFVDNQAELSVSADTEQLIFSLANINLVVHL